MSQAGDVKIRVLPRGEEGKAAAKMGKPIPAPKPARPRRVIIGLFVGSFLLAALAFVLPDNTSRNPASVPNTDKKIDELITKHMQESQLKHDMLVRKREIENEQFHDDVNKPSVDGDVWNSPPPTDFGVQLNGDDSADRVYADLHDASQDQVGDFLPDDKINARLANRKWMNEMERAERIQFIKNYIKAAYDRGYEVEIDQNLVVVGVHHIGGTRKLDINKVLDQLDRKGF